MSLPREEELRRIYRDAGQEHVFRFSDALDPEARDRFYRQLASIDLDLVTELASGSSPRLDSGTSGPATNLEPADALRTGDEPPFATRREALEEGRRLVAEGKVAAVLVAGGQASRLGFDGPKGALRAGPLSGKSLFQIQGERLLALQHQLGRAVPWYIMTSAANDAATKQHFVEADCFGLAPNDVSFFVQGQLPAVDLDGKLLLAEAGAPFMSPDGHGGIFDALARSGSLDDMAAREIECIFFHQVDNLLIRMADPTFLGLHRLSGAPVSSKVLRRSKPEEKIGVFAVRDGITRVVEYSDLLPADAKRRTADGELYYWAGNIAIHAFELEFVRSIAQGGADLPYHVAKKNIPALSADGATAEIPGRKFEKFVFDAIPAASSSFALEVVREEEFAPIKNASGDDSLESAQELLVAEHRKWLARAGIEVTGRVEISPLAALDADELARRLVGAESRYTVDVRVEPSDDGGARIVPVDS